MKPEEYEARYEAVRCYFGTPSYQWGRILARNEKWQVQGGEVLALLFGGEPRWSY